VSDRTRSGSSVSQEGFSGDTLDAAPGATRLVPALILSGLVALAAVFGLRTMLSYDVITDETAHLASWRNRYSGDMVSPYLVRKFADTKSISPAVRRRVVDAYLDHPPLRFMTYWLTDSPVFSTIAESVRAASGSNVHALRAVSLIAVLLTVPLLLRLGRVCWDMDLGFWLASLFVATPMIQFYAGIGRSYALIQLTTLLLIYRYVLFVRTPGSSSRPVLLAALLAQSIHPAAWFAAFPIVVGTMAMTWHRGATIVDLIRHTWWYGCACVALLVPMAAAVIVSPSVGGNLSFGFKGLRDNLDLVNPFGALVGLDGTAFSRTSIGLFLTAICLGIWAVRQRVPRGAGITYIALSGLTSAIAGALVAGGAPRHLLVYLPVPLLVAAIGMRAILGTGTRGRLFGLAAVAAQFGVALVFPVDGYKRMLPQEGRFSVIAEWLHKTMGEADEWAAWPYYYSSPIYNYALLAEPFLPITRDDFEAHMAEERPGSLYVLTVDSAARASPLLSRLAPVAQFTRRSGDFVVYVIDSKAVPRPTNLPADAEEGEAGHRSPRSSTTPESNAAP
jgi:hypothetical protein